MQACSRLWGAWLVTSEAQIINKNKAKQIVLEKHISNLKTTLLFNPVAPPKGPKRAPLGQTMSRKTPPRAKWRVQDARSKVQLINLIGFCKNACLAYAGTTFWFCDVTVHISLSAIQYTTISLGVFWAQNHWFISIKRMILKRTHVLVK